MASDRSGNASHVRERGERKEKENEERRRDIIFNPKIAWFFNLREVRVGFGARRKGHGCHCNAIVKDKPPQL